VQQHLLHGPLGGVDRCDLRSLPCSAGPRELQAYLRSTNHGLDERPLRLTGCDEALGFVPHTDLTPARLSEAGERSKRHVVIHPSSADIAYFGGGVRHRNDREVPMSHALHQDFYFDAANGILTNHLERSTSRKRAPEAMWLEAFLGMYSMTSDSVQKDTSIVAHTHLRSWMYLASGLKLWYLSPFENPPPAEVQWSLPLDSWLRQGAVPFTNATWSPIICMQKPGDVLISPSFYWHATVSLGTTVAFGRQGPRSGGVRMPALIQRLQSTRGPRFMEALWAMYESNPYDLKLLRKIGEQAQDADTATRLRKASRRAIKKAAALRAAGRITRKDAALIESTLRACCLGLSLDGRRARSEL